MMKNILVVSGHTDLNNSVANKTILEELTRQLPEAEFAYLDKLYPDFKIDRVSEQQKLMKADIIVLQYPFFWYSMPSILARWVEEVFQHGFSHGLTGDKLKGKKLVASITTGALESVYSYEGALNHPMEHFLVPLKSTANLCGIEWAGYIHTGGVSYHNRKNEQKLVEMRDQSINHANRIVELLKML